MTAVVWTLVSLVVAFFFPRILIHTLGEAHPVTSYLYMYGLGFMVFLIGLVVVLRFGACRPNERPLDAFWFKVMIGGFVFFLSLHGLWILLALKMPLAPQLTGALF